MILIPVIQNDFWYDHGVSLGSAIVTFLAFLLTFITLIHNSNKEKKEAENRSKKTLSVMDFIFEKNSDQLGLLMEQVESIKETRPEDSGIYGNASDYILDKEKREDRDLYYYTDYRGISVTVPGMNRIVKTKFQHNYIVLETYRYLEKENFILKLNQYEEEIKTNLKSQHLNITSDSLGKISDKIHAIKESKSILRSMRIKKLLQISILEVIGRTENEINEQVGESVQDYIREDYEKFLKLESELKKVITPLNSDGSF